MNVIHVLHKTTTKKYPNIKPFIEYHKYSNIIYVFHYKFHIVLLYLTPRPLFKYFIFKILPLNKTLKVCLTKKNLLHNLIIITIGLWAVSDLVEFLTSKSFRFFSKCRHAFWRNIRQYKLIICFIYTFHLPTVWFIRIYVDLRFFLLLLLFCFVWEVCCWD